MSLPHLHHLQPLPHLRILRPRLIIKPPTFGAQRSPARSIASAKAAGSGSVIIPVRSSLSSARSRLGRKREIPKRKFRRLWWRPPKDGQPWVGHPWKGPRSLEDIETREVDVEDILSRYSTKYRDDATPDLAVLRHVLGLEPLHKTVLDEQLLALHLDGVSPMKCLPGTAMKDVLLVSVDINTTQTIGTGIGRVLVDSRWNRQLDNVQVGVSILDTRDIRKAILATAAAAATAVAEEEGAREGGQKPDAAKNRPLIRSLLYSSGLSFYTTLQTRDFVFGPVTVGSRKMCTERLESIIQHSNRNVVMICHEAKLELDFCKTYGVPLAPQPLALVDTAYASSILFGHGKKLSLEHLMEWFGLPTPRLRSAGHDAHFTLRAALMLAAIEHRMLDERRLKRPNSLPHTKKYRLECQAIVHALTNIAHDPGIFKGERVLRNFMEDREEYHTCAGQLRRMMKMHGSDPDKSEEVKECRQNTLISSRKVAEHIKKFREAYRSASGGSTPPFGGTIFECMEYDYHTRQTERRILRSE